MGFLDNSGDIILDAVLTDTGRRNLARGDGSFSISKFAIGDEEIDYGLYNTGSATGLEDVNIMTSPILEAFTDNGASMKTNLITIPRNNLLYLPVLKLNQTNNKQSKKDGVYYVAVDENTQKPSNILGDNTTFTYNTPMFKGVIKGFTPGDNDSGMIVVDQGLDTTDINFAYQLDPTLVETQYLIQLDHRLGHICDINGTNAKLSYIDDDNIALYVVSQGSNFVAPINNTTVDADSGNTEENDQVIKGPRGTRMRFKIRSSIDLLSGVTLFKKLGSTKTWTSDDGGGATLKSRIIQSTVRVLGATTGYRIDIPVTFVKAVAAY